MSSSDQAADVLDGHACCLGDVFGGHAHGGEPPGNLFVLQPPALSHAFGHALCHTFHESFGASFETALPLVGLAVHPQVLLLVEQLLVNPHDLIPPRPDELSYASASLAGFEGPQDRVPVGPLRRHGIYYSTDVYITLQKAPFTDRDLRRRRVVEEVLHHPSHPRHAGMSSADMHDVGLPPGDGPLPCVVHCHPVLGEVFLERRGQVEQRP